MRIIDTHIHTIHVGRMHYPWLNGEPTLRRNFSLDEYLQQATPAGIEAAIHVEADVEEAHLAAETAIASSAGRGVVALVAGCRPESRAFPVQLEQLAENPMVKGLRRTFHFTPDEMAQAPLFAANVSLLSRYGLTFDLCALARQLPVAARLASQCPDVQFIVDHCGIPNIRDRLMDPWREDMRNLAALPNVACKISGLIGFGVPTGWTAEDFRPYVEHVVKVFGWDRLLWGSNWPVCTLAADLMQWINVTNTLFLGATEQQKLKLFSDNAERIYRLKVVGLHGSKCATNQQSRD